MRRSSFWFAFALVACATTACEKKEAPANEVGANLGLSASSKPAPLGHEATHVQQQKPTSSAQVGGSKTETIGGNKSTSVNH